MQSLASARVAATTRSKRSTRSPDRRSAGRRAPRSARMDIVGARRPRARRAQSLGCSSCRPFVRRRMRRARLDRREGRPGLLQAEDAGGSESSTLDPATLDYRPKQPAQLPSLDAARVIDDAGERIQTLFLGKDKVGDFLRATLGPTLDYTAHGRAEIAYSIDDVDRAMRWGFGWELGPFEIDRVRCELRRRLRSPPAAIVPRPTACRGGAGPSDSEAAKDRGRVVRRERRREPRRSRRRRARGRIPLEDERDRRRHHPDAARRREGSRRRTSPRSSSATTRRTSPPAPT